MPLWSTQQQFRVCVLCDIDIFIRSTDILQIFLLPPFIYHHHCSLNIYYSISFQVSASICIKIHTFCVYVSFDSLINGIKNMRISVEGLLEYQVCCLELCLYGFVHLINVYKPLYSMSSYLKHQPCLISDKKLQHIRQRSQSYS